jgi:deoxyribodipyrimidine photolyase-like uncharacterized protein
MSLATLTKRLRSKQFFFEKKNQKTFVLIALRALTLPHRAHHQQKFLLLFSKRSAFLLQAGQSHLLLV